MHIYNIHKAKTHLSRLIDLAAKGEPFVIAKAGKPMVKVMALNAPEPSEMRRTGFMAREIKVPGDFDRMGSEDTEKCSVYVHDAPPALSLRLGSHWLSPRS